MARKQGQLCGFAVMVLLAASEVRTLAQIFDLTNAVPLTNGPLYVDLRAVNAASGVWANFGSLGNFMPVGNPTLIRNVAGETAGFGTGIPGVAFDGANDAYQGPNSVSNIDGSSDRSIEVWALNPSLEDEETTVSWGHRGVVRRNLGFGFGANSGYGAASHYGDDFGWNVNPTAQAWHYLAYTYVSSNNTVAIYVDGVVRDTRALGGPLNTFTNEPINLGCQRDFANGTRSKFYSGYLNTVRVQGGALTADQVARNYLMGPVLAVSTNSPISGTNPAGMTITFSDVGQLPWNVNSYGKIPENYQPSELLGSGITTRWINVGGYNGGPDHTPTADNFSAFEYNGGISPSIVIFNTNVFVRSLWVDIYAGDTTHVYVRGYTYANDPVPAVTVDVPTYLHPWGSGYRWTQVTALDGIPIQKLVVESSVYGDNAQFDDITIQQAPANTIPPRNFLYDKLTIMPLGDSITLGYSAPGGYRTKLLQNLKRAGYNAVFVGSDTTNPGPMPLDQEAHEGHQGYTIYEDNANLDNNVPPYGTVASQNDWNNGGYWISRLNRPPDIILVHLGTNDIGRGQDGNGMAAASNMDALLTHIYSLAPNAYVIVAKIVAVNGSVNANVIEFNNQLPGVVADHAATGQHVTLVDQYANFVDDYGNVKGYLQFDGVHPNQGGYDLMADTWFHGIRALFPTIVASNPPPVVVGPVAVENFSFETNTLSDGGRSVAPAWIISAPSGGIYNPQADAFATAADGTGGLLPAPALGRQLAFIQNEPSQIGSIQQMFPDIYLANNTIYTLSAAVGRALNGYSYSSDIFSGYKIELLAGGAVIATQQDSFVPLPGAFQDATLVFTASTNTVPTNSLGRALTIRLSSDRNPSGSTASTFFDNVRLSTVPIPPLLTITRNTNQVVISWPANYIGWRLQVQTNSLNAGLRGNWVDVAGSTTVDNVNLAMDPAAGAVFLRMVYP